MIEGQKFTAGRRLVLLTYKRPFVAWLLTMSPSPLSKKSINDLCVDNDAFLIPEEIASNNEVAQQWVETNWRMLLEMVLSGWQIEKSEWPERPTLEMFQEWFAVQHQGKIWDLGTIPSGRKKLRLSRSANQGHAVPQLADVTERH